MERFLQQLKLNDQLETQTQGDPETNLTEMAKLKREIENHLENERALQADLTLLKSQVAHLKRQNEETKVKSHSMNSLQDEILALQLELNQSEAQVASLTQENRDLVDRWVARINAEARVS